MMTWWPGSLTGKKSHPDKCLVDHLEGVAALAKRLAQTHGVLDKADIEKLFDMSLTHDLAKARDKWQRYLEGKGEGTPHSESSSFFTLDLTHDVMAAELVRCHHGSLKNIEDVKSFWVNDDFKLCDIVSKIKEILPEWEPSLNDATWEKINNDLLFEFKTDENFWLRYRALLSYFIAADRMDALGVSGFDPTPLRFKQPSFDQRNDLDKWRQEVRVECLDNAKCRGEPGVYTLTLPTGTGKTTIGLEIAHMWAKKHGYQSIIYALPFISITEQNAEVARRLLGEDAVQEDHSMIKRGGDDDTPSPLKRMEALFRYWHLPVVITTMAHLWEVLYGDRVNSTINFHQLGKSVVILDEPQSIQAEHWAGLGKTLHLVSKKFKTAFILMTATQPHIAESATEIAPCACQKPISNRYHCKILREELSLGKLPDVLNHHLPLKEPSGLIVANTRREALKIHKIMCEMQEKQQISRGPVLFLSTWMTPAHRRRTLKKLRDLEKEDHPRFLVSTQVVEAGVDLDFHWVARDEGPLDSVIQVAGRCNRHGKRNVGMVLVVRLKNDRGKRFSRMVYDSILLQAMEEVTSEISEFEERQIGDVVGKYYERVSGSKKGSGLWDDIVKGKWATLPPLYAKERPALVTLVVEAEDSNVGELVDFLIKEEWNLKNIEEKKSFLREIQQHAVEIPEKLLLKCREKSSSIPSSKNPLRQINNSDMWFLSKEAVSILYDPVTGFTPPEEEDDDINGCFV
jgi:CRISPR-associated endonuclease/helicase Cas3